MGIFDLLSKEGRARSAMSRYIKKTNDKWAQSQDRFAAMEKLRDIGTDDALYGMVRRFGFVYDKTIEDEQEKEWIASTLSGMGERAIPPLRRFIMQGDTISYPLRVLGGIATPEKVFEILDELAEREEPGYTRHPEKKIQFLTWLAEWKEATPPEIAKRVVPYLADFDETVRFTAVEALSHQLDEETERGPLLDALVRPEEESRRIKVRIADLLVQAGWRVDDTPEHKTGVVALLNEQLTDYGLSHEKIFKKGK